MTIPVLSLTARTSHQMMNRFNITEEEREKQAQKTRKEISDAAKKSALDRPRDEHGRFMSSEDPNFEEEPK